MAVGKRKAIEYCATAVGTHGRGYGYTRGSICFYKKKDAERYIRRANKKGDAHYLVKREVIREVRLPIRSK